MANPEHVDVVKRGTAAIVEWLNQKDGRGLFDLNGAILGELVLEPIDGDNGTLIHANLNGANLGSAQLDRAQLIEVSLQSADLNNATLNDANLSSARLTHAKLMSASLIHATLTKAQLAGAKLQNADLTGADLGDASLNNADFTGANLTEAKLQGTILHANFTHANLSRADLRNTSTPEEVLKWKGPGIPLKGKRLPFPPANFTNANLFGADLSNADLPEAEFRGANLTRTNLRETILKGANLRDANLANAILRDTHLELSDLRGAQGLCFDNTYVRGARFSPRSKDPWSILRRHYTGPKFMFVVVFTLVAFLPYLAQTLFWIGVGSAERQTLPLATKVIAKTLEVLEQTPAPRPAQIEAWRSKARVYLIKVQPWVERYHQLHGNAAVDPEDLETAIELAVTGANALSDASDWAAEHREQFADAEDELSQAREIMRALRPSGKVERRWIWELLLGRDRGTLPMLLLVVLLIYNGLRFILTYYVGPLREDEERTGFTPAWEGWSGYRWLWRTHRVASVLFWISLSSVLYQFGLILFTPILVPR